MKKAWNISFIIGWLLLSAFAVSCLFTLTDIFVWLPLGFSTPSFSYYMFVLSAGLLDYVDLGMLYILIGLAFTVTVIVSLFLIRKTKLFYYLVLADSFVVIIEMALFAIVTHEALEALAVFWLVAELLIKFALLLFLFLFFRKRAKNSAPAPIEASANASDN